MNSSVKILFYLLIVAVATSLLGGCNNGSSAPPPTNITPIAGDGRVLLTWTGDPGVDYWLFTATAPSLTAFNWTDLPNARAFTRVESPFYLCSLYSDTPYYFAMNGRINGGPGGDSSPTYSATPYDATATWKLSTTSLIQPIYGLGYTSLTTCSYTNPTSAAGTFVAVGANGAIFVSDKTDGITSGLSWNDRSLSGYLYSLNAVAGYAANQNYPTNPALRWVAVGEGGASYYSLDGDTWTAGKAYNSANPSLRSITHVAGTFYAVGDAGTILSSSDGITWTTHNSPSVSPSDLYGVTHGNIYVAVGNVGTILISSDGNTWIVKTSGTSNTLRQVASFGSVYVAVGDAGTIVTSKDSGATWTTLPPLGTVDLVGVTVEFHLEANPITDPVLGYISPAQFVAVDNSGNAYTSPNGITWTPTASTGISTNALVSSGFGYVAAGNAGATAYAF
jgi:photosystem II stability/assembly factor-like uncharacterized protein